MFLHVSVILFTGGGCVSQCMLGYTPPGPEADTPRGQTPHSADNPLEQTPPPGPGAENLPPPGADPPAQCMLGDTGNKRAVRILLECILVFLFITLYLNIFQSSCN